MRFELGDRGGKLTDEDVFKKTGLGAGDVCKPTTHDCG